MRRVPEAAGDEALCVEGLAGGTSPGLSHSLGAPRLFSLLAVGRGVGQCRPHKAWGIKGMRCPRMTGGDDQGRLRKPPGFPGLVGGQWGDIKVAPERRKLRLREAHGSPCSEPPGRWPPHCRVSPQSPGDPVQTGPLPQRMSTSGLQPFRGVDGALDRRPCCFVCWHRFVTTNQAARFPEARLWKLPRLLNP